MKALRNVYWMEKVEQDSMEEIAFCLEHSYYEDNQILFRAGDIVDKIFFIGSGEVEILVSLEDHEILVETLKSGSIIGFNGILTNGFHNFTARSKNKVSLYILKKDILKQLLNSCEDLYEEVTKARDYYK
jgi:CRP-like cAMP-binding protein